MSGDGDRYGVNTSLSRGQFIVALFNNQFEAKLSDKELVEMIKEEFPKSESNYGGYIRMYRNKYNRGDFACQAEAPEVPVPRFDNEGKAVVRQRGPEPRYSWQDKEKRK